MTVKENGPRNEQTIELLDMLSFKGMSAKQAEGLSADELHSIIGSAYQKMGALSVAVDDEIDKISRSLVLGASRGAARIGRLEYQLKAMLNHYCQLAGCGDCGNWDPEEEKIIIETRKLLNDNSKSTKT